MGTENLSILLLIILFYNNLFFKITTNKKNIKNIINIFCFTIK